jgi:hypothetical protein
MKTWCAACLLLMLGLQACSFSAATPGSPARPSAIPPSISQITPGGGPVGSEVTITGSGFASTGNTVKFGAGNLRSLTSEEGTTLRFVVPDGLDLCAPDTAGPCPGSYPQVTPGDYAVAVMTRGGTSNSVTFTVTRR